MIPKRKLKSRKRKIIYLIVGAILLISAVIAYRFIQFNLWISSDAGLLQPYPRVLVKDEEVVAGQETPETQKAERIDNALVKALARDRIVLNLSRSEIRYNPLGSRAYVKIFLKTALPKDRSRNTSIKFLATLQRTNGDWKLEATQDLSIE